VTIRSVSHSHGGWPDSSLAGSIGPMSMTYEDALNDRVAEMTAACTRCGKCVEACPVMRAASPPSRAT
jgi:Fe-S oxidoreductase